MTIVLNGESKTLPSELSLGDLIAQLSLPENRIAIEVNEVLVRRTNFEQTTLREGDRVEIVTLVGGG